MVEVFAAAAVASATAVGAVVSSFTRFTAVSTLPRPRAAGATYVRRLLQGNGTSRCAVPAPSCMSAWNSKAGASIAPALSLLDTAAATAKIGGTR